MPETSGTLSRHLRLNSDDASSIAESSSHTNGQDLQRTKSSTTVPLHSVGVAWSPLYRNGRWLEEGENSGWSPLERAKHNPIANREAEPSFGLLYQCRDDG